jgi:xylulokinase
VLESVERDEATMERITGVLSDAAALLERESR